MTQMKLDRLEFLQVKIECNQTAKVDMEGNFPQISDDFESTSILMRSALAYSNKEINDVRHFAVTYGIKIKSDEKTEVPYEIEVEARALLHYLGDEFSGVDRFRAARMTAYQICYGAIREMVANITARSSHGLWHLPAQHFGRMAEIHAKEDEKERQTKLKRSRSKKKAIADTSDVEVKSPKQT